MDISTAPLVVQSVLLDGFQQLDRIFLDGTFAVFTGFDLLLHRLGTVAPDEGASLGDVVATHLPSLHPCSTLFLELDLALTVPHIFGGSIGGHTGAHGRLDWSRVEWRQILWCLGNILATIEGALHTIDEMLRHGLKIRGLLG